MSHVKKQTRTDLGSLCGAASAALDAVVTKKTTFLPATNDMPDRFRIEGIVFSADERGERKARGLSWFLRLAAALKEHGSILEVGTIKGEDGVRIWIESSKERELNPHATKAFLPTLLNLIRPMQEDPRITVINAKIDYISAMGNSDSAIENSELSLRSKEAAAIEAAAITDKIFQVARKRMIGALNPQPSNHDYWMGPFENDQKVPKGVIFPILNNLMLFHGMDSMAYQVVDLGQGQCAVLCDAREMEILLAQERSNLANIPLH